MIKKYKQYNEGIKHLLVGPTDDELKDYIKINPSRALLTYCKKNNLELVKLSLESGADPDYDNGHPLLYACGRKSHNIPFNIDILHLLIEYNVDVTIDRNENLRECCYDYNEDNWDNLKIIELLLNAGADVHVVDDLCMNYAQMHNEELLINLLEKYYDNYGVEEYDEEIKEIEPSVEDCFMELSVS